MRKKSENRRRLLPGFKSSLKEGGILHSLLERVKKDPTLCLEIRNNYINIYYRGGNLIEVKEKEGFVAHFDTNYCSGAKNEVIETLRKNSKLLVKDNVDTWINAIPSLKQAMDFWFGKHPKEEREFQQIVLRENNGLVIGSGTDYFIIDVEYDNHSDARFDLVAVEWESKSSARKLQKGYRPKLCFIEMKYGDGALSGKAGVIDHIDKFSSYVKNAGLKNIKDEMLEAFRQKRKLGLIPALENNKNQVKIFSDDVDFIFLFANHDSDSRKLKDILTQIREKYQAINLGFNLKFCFSNFMGYGLYKQNVYSLSEFMNKFEEQISCNL